MIPSRDRPVTPSEWSRAAELVVAVTSRAFKVPAKELLAHSRGEQRIAYARQVAMYLTHIVFGGTYQDAGAPFGRERTTVAYACSIVEDDRDEQSFDRKLDLLEEMLTRLWSLQELQDRENGRSAAKDQAAA
jgi:chromosomal replication initiation ATPase DnaA